MSLATALAGKIMNAKKAEEARYSFSRRGDLKLYTPRDRRAGDVYFHIVGDGHIGHVNMIAPDVAYKIDSVFDSVGKAKGDDNSGVRKLHLSRDKHHGPVFRFHDAKVAADAALLAESWIGKTGYSDSNVGPVAARAAGLVFGTCHFGKGAAGRLLKYRSRADLAPKNITCPELIILAFQLAMDDDSKPAFIKLDAKHCSPNSLLLYFSNNQSHWTYEGERVSRQ